MQRNSTFINRSQFSQHTTSGAGSSGAGSLLVTLLLPVTLLLAACGGGGGESSNFIDDSPSGIIFIPSDNTGSRLGSTVKEAERTRIENDANVVIGRQTAMANIARALPSRGSVTQSSRHQTGPTGAVTRDQLKVELSYSYEGEYAYNGGYSYEEELQAKVTNVGDDAGWSNLDGADWSTKTLLTGNSKKTDDDGSKMPPGTLDLVGRIACPKDEKCTRFREFFSVQDRGTVTTLTDDGLVTLDLFTDKMNNAQTDYTAGAVWMYLPRAFAETGGADFADVEIGAFAEVYTDNVTAGPTPREYLTRGGAIHDPIATYSGQGIAQSYRSHTSESGTTSDSYDKLVVYVELTANFRNPLSGQPSVSGQIYGVRDFQHLLDNDPDKFHTDPGGGVFELTLDPAEIGVTQGTLGFFTGGINDSPDIASAPHYVGKWGGQFYDEDAGRVAGTFGASGSSDEFGTATIAGFFHATTDEPAEPEEVVLGE